MISDAKEILERVGLKLTEPRLALIKALMAAPGPTSALQLQRRLNRQSRSLDRATVFRNLKALAGAGLLESSEFGTGSHFYWLKSKVQNHFHHLFCTHCEKAEPISYCGISPMMVHAKKKGFHVQQHRMELIGICRSCQEAERR